MYTIPDDCLYQQLSEDWRHRDRITWQIPSVLAVIGGLLLSTTFGIVGGVTLTQDDKFWLLLVGCLFTFLLVILLMRNLYLQGVGSDLMEQIKVAGEHLDEARKAAQRVPRRRRDYGFPTALSRLWQTPTSVLLILFCAFMAGIYFFFIASNRNWWPINYWWILLGGLIPLMSGGLFIRYSHWREVVKHNVLQHYQLNITSQICNDLKSGRIVVGTMFRDIRRLRQRDNPLQLARDCGYRFVVIDHEHKGFDEETLEEYAELAHRIGISLWIRPAQLNEVPISRYADIGFNGFMIPNTIDNTRVLNIIDQAYFRPVARETAYPRRGYSMGSVVLDGQRFENIGQEIDYANKNMLVVLQTEHPAGIDNLASLLSIDGIIGTIVGPNDLAINLSKSHGNPNIIELNKAQMYKQDIMKQAYQNIGKIAKNNGKVAGIHFTDPSEMDLVELLVTSEFGYRLILLGTEANFDHQKIIETKKHIENMPNYAPSHQE